MTEESKVMEFGTHVGQVSKFFNRKGFGFIRDLNEDKDYFVHNSDIMLKDNGYRKLYPGEYVSFNIGKKDDGRDKCVDVRGILGGLLLTENPDHNYRIFPKQNPVYGGSSNGNPSGNPSDSDSDDSSTHSVDNTDPEPEDDPESEVKEVINKGAPEGIEVAEFDGLNINEEMG